MVNTTNADDHEQKDEISYEDMPEGEITEKKRNAVKETFRGIKEDKSWKEIAEAADCSERYLRKIRKTQTFWNLWHEEFDEELELMLPQVTQAFEKALKKDNRQTTQVAKMIMNALGMTEPESKGDQQVLVIERSDKEKAKEAENQEVVDIARSDDS